MVITYCGNEECLRGCKHGTILFLGFGWEHHMAFKTGMRRDIESRFKMTSDPLFGRAG
jgi:hypothetical protein